MRVDVVVGTAHTHTMTTIISYYNRGYDDGFTHTATEVAHAGLVAVAAVKAHAIGMQRHCTDQTSHAAGRWAGVIAACDERAFALGCYL